MCSFLAVEYFSLLPVRLLDHLRDQLQLLADHHSSSEDKHRLRPSGRAGDNYKEHIVNRDQAELNSDLLEAGSVSLVSLEFLAAGHHHVEQIPAPGTSSPGGCLRPPLPSGILQPFPLLVAHQVVSRTGAEDIKSYGEGVGDGCLDIQEELSGFK